MQEQVLSLTELHSLITQTLNYAYPQVTVEAEVANYKINQNKWVFFDLKDEETVMACFMSIYQLGTPLQDGMKVRVLCTPKLTHWGKFSLTVKSYELVGDGTVKKAFELLKAQLEQEGLLDLQHKRVLPRYPQRIAVITSKEAAAYNDFMKIVNARWAGMSIDHIQVQVQGSIAPEQIVEAISYCNTHTGSYDAIVLIRGGGSAEDLQAFQTEPIVRAIYSSKIPTLVGIGHEDDVSLAELAADVRAATPTDAARLLVPDKKELMSYVQSTVRLQQQFVEQQAVEVHHTLDRYYTSCQYVLSNTSQYIDQMIARMQLAMQNQYQKTSTIFYQLVHSLRVLDPELVLRRGYAVVRKDQHVVVDAFHLKKHDDIMIQLHQANVTATIIEITHEQKNKSSK